MAKTNMHISEFANAKVSQDIISWLLKIDKILMENNCKVEAGITMRGQNGRFSYASKNKTVCIVYITPDGCKVSMRGNHFVESNETCINNILDELPKHTYDYVMKGAGREGHIVSPTIFEHNGRKSHRCKENPGWNFDLNGSTDFEMLIKWIEYEIMWKASKTKRTE